MIQKKIVTSGTLFSICRAMGDVDRWVVAWTVLMDGRMATGA